MRCRAKARPGWTYRARGPPRAVEKFYGEPRHSDDTPPDSGRAGRGSGEDSEAGSVRVEPDGGDVCLHLGSDAHVLTREEAERLRTALGDALTRREEYLHTTGEHREDGSYVVARRGADSSGHRKVFDSFRGLERLFERLPAEFTAEHLGGTGLTGGRRHMVLRHLVEHPAFDCDLVSRQPLTARKRSEVTDV